MRKRYLLLGAVLLAGVGATGASAATKTGRFAVEDAGLFTCAEHNNAKRSKPPLYARMLGFIEGYVTAANRYEPNNFDLAPWHSMPSFGIILTSHCQKKPQDTLVVATQRLIEALRPQRLTDVSEMILIKEGPKPTPVYKSILQRAQSELTRKGLYKGPSDGNFSPETKLALQTFQRSVKLPADGLPNPPTLWLLLNP